LDHFKKKKRRTNVAIRAPGGRCCGLLSPANPVDIDGCGDI